MNNDYTIIELKSGLGNQIFQYAFSLNFPKIYFDISRYSSTSHRRFDLQHFNVKLDFATKAQCRHLLKPIFLPRFIRKLFHLPKYRGKWEEPQGIIYDAVFFNLKNRYISGYFNNWRYFDHLRSRLLQDITLTAPLDDANSDMLKQITSTDSVFIHIRRTDYITHNLPVLSQEYYSKAVAHIHHHSENPHFFIFSDDISWCQENLSALGCHSCTFVTQNDALHGYLDLELMRHCKHAIIANSSFSWWGAYLINHPDKIIISPADHYSTTPTGVYYPPPPPMNNWVIID